MTTVRSRALLPLAGGSAGGRWPALLRRWALAAFASALAWAPSAGADVREEAARIVDQWTRGGGAVSVGPPRFLYDDETVYVQLPAGTDKKCTSIALLGARGLSFHARVGGVEDDVLGEDPAVRASSVAGVVELERCDDSPIRYVVVTSDADR